MLRIKRRMVGRRDSVAFASSDDILSHRLHAILVRDVPLLPAYDERRWAKVAGYSSAGFDSSLEVYAQRRMELVNMLRMVTLADWQRLGAHEVKGQVSLLDIATSLVEHEEEHCLPLEAADQQ